MEEWFSIRLRPTLRRCLATGAVRYGPLKIGIRTSCPHLFWSRASCPGSAPTRAESVFRSQVSDFSNLNSCARFTRLSRPYRFGRRALNCFVDKYAFSSNFPLHHSNFFSPRFLPALRWVGASRAMARLQRGRYYSASWPNNNDRHPCRHGQQAAASMTAVMHHSTETLKANTQHVSTVEAVAPSKHDSSAAGRTSVL